MSTTRIPAADVPPGSVTGAGEYAVGNNGEFFVLTKAWPLHRGTVTRDGDDLVVE